jgi:hypothetical protein
MTTRMARTIGKMRIILTKYKTTAATLRTARTTKTATPRRT